MISTDQTSINVVLETTAGTTPTDPTLQGVRFTSDTLGEDVNQIISGELNTTRIPADSIRAGIRNQGSIVGELSKDDGFDILLESAFGNTWQANVLGIGNLDQTLTIEKRMDTGATSGGPYDHVRTGVVANGFTLTCNPEEIATIEFPFVGGNVVSTTPIVLGTGSRVAKGSNPVMTAIGCTITLGGGLSSVNGVCITASSLTLNNQARGTQCVGFAGDKHTTRGQALVEGTLTMLFTNNDVMNQFLDAAHTFTITWAFSDGTNTYTFNVPKARLRQADVPTPGTSQDATYSLAFDGLNQAGTNLSLQRSA